MHTILRSLIGLCLALGACAPTARRMKASGGGAILSTYEEGTSASLLADTSREAVEAGAEELLTLAEGVGDQGDTFSGVIGLSAGSCMLLYARGSAGIRDLDLQLFDDEGGLVASDERETDPPTISFCADEERRLFFVARIVRGHGILAIGAHAVGAQIRQTVTDATGAIQGQLPRDRLASEWPALSDTLKLRSEELGVELAVDRALALPLDHRLKTYLGSHIRKGECRNYLLLIPPHLRGVSVQVSTASGASHTRDTTSGDVLQFALCSSDAESSLSLSVSTESGRGQVLFVESSLTDLSGRPGPAFTELSGRRGGTAWEHPKELNRELTIRSGEISSLEFSVDGCVPLASKVKWGRPPRGIWAWDEMGKLVAHSRASSEKPLLLCGHGRIRVDVEGEDGEQIMFLGLLSPLKDDRVLLSHPLSASRLYEAWHDSPPLPRTGLLRLQAEQAVFLKFENEVGACTRFALSQADGEGEFTVRVSGPRGVLSHQVVRQAHAVSIQECATGKHSMELSSHGGELQLLILRSSANQALPR